MKTVIVLNNNKKIKVKNMVLEDSLKVSFNISAVFIGWFSSSNTALKEGYFQSWFRKSRKFTFNSNIAPTYTIKDNKLTVTAELEEI